MALLHLTGILSKALGSSLPLQAGKTIQQNLQDLNADVDLETHLRRLLNHGAGWLLVHTGELKDPKAGFDPEAVNEDGTYTKGLSNVVHEDDEYMIVIVYNPAGFWSMLWGGIKKLASAVWTAVKTVVGWVWSGVKKVLQWLGLMEDGLEGEEQQPEEDESANDQNLSSALNNRDLYGQSVQWVWGKRKVGSLQVTSLISFNGPRYHRDAITSRDKLGRRSWYSLGNSIRSSYSSSSESTVDQWFADDSKKRLHRHRSKLLKNRLLRNSYLVKSEYKNISGSPFVTEAEYSWVFRLNNYYSYFSHLWNYYSKEIDLSNDAKFAQVINAVDLIHSYLLIYHTSYDRIAERNGLPAKSPACYSSLGYWRNGHLADHDIFNPPPDQARASGSNSNDLSPPWVITAPVINPTSTTAASNLAALGEHSNFDKRTSGSTSTRKYLDLSLINWTADLNEGQPSSWSERSNRWILSLAEIRIVNAFNNLDISLTPKWNGRSSSDNVSPPASRLA